MRRFPINFSIRQVQKKNIKRFCQFFLLLFLVVNVLCFAGAYRLTHFTPKNSFGLGLPRPENIKNPSAIQLNYVTHRIPINENEWLEAWLIPKQKSKGTVLLFPGNIGNKANLLAHAQSFYNLGYNTLLVDFRGVGGSSGNATTVGMAEAKDVAVVMNYLQSLNLNRPIILYGVSMGSAAILKAMAPDLSQKQINPDGIILELPFARFLDAVRSRFRAIRVPSFPVAELIVFWGSVQHGFNGFAHNPVTYANFVKCPALIMHGRLDKWTTEREIIEIWQNLAGFKELVIFPTAGHDVLLSIDESLWTRSVESFIDKI